MQSKRIHTSEIFFSVKLLFARFKSILCLSCRPHHIPLAHNGLAGKLLPVRVHEHARDVAVVGDGGAEVGRAGVGHGVEGAQPAVGVGQGWVGALSVC